LSPGEVKIYQHARTLMDWTPQEVRSVPILHKLRFSGNQDELPAILERVGEAALVQVKDFPKVACDEEVYSETNLPNPLASWGGMRRNSTIHKFRYIVIPRRLDDSPAFDEYRTDAKGTPIDIARLGDLKMITSDFTSTWLYFSLTDQPESRFRYFGKDTAEKRQCYVVGFAQKPEAAQNVSGFQLEDHAAALLVQGIAWIDEKTYAIVTIRTWLLAPRTDMGLAEEDTTVNYLPVEPESFPRAIWVPHDVTVIVRFQGAYYRNSHRYSRYELFRVQSVIKP